MLEIINSLRPFFEDAYRRINIREYARIMKISPPTASSRLKLLKKEGLLNEEIDRKYNYFLANKENRVFIDFSRIYWGSKIRNSGLLDFLKTEMISPIVILFGSLSKGEALPNSDIDLAIFTVSKKELKLEKFKKNMRRNLQVFVFKTREEVKNPELLNNILNGYKLFGEW